MPEVDYPDIEIKDDTTIGAAEENFVNVYKNLTVDENNKHVLHEELVTIPKKEYVDEVAENLKEELGESIVAESNEWKVVDEAGNIIFSVDANGAHTTELTLDGKKAATEEYVGDAIANIKIPETDLTDYATKKYVDNKVADLVNSAPEALNTLGELATALENHEDAYDALLETVGGKATKTELEDLKTEISESIVSETTEFHIVDDDGNIIASINENGFETTKVVVDGISVKNKDETLAISDKTIVGAINELNGKISNESKFSEGLEYQLYYSNEFYSVFGIGTCTDDFVIIPSEYEGLPVTSIYDYAFTHPAGVEYGEASFTSIFIPKSVTNGMYFSLPMGHPVTVFCEAESQPDGWYPDWQTDNLTVIWGFANDFVTVNEKIDAVSKEIADAINELNNKINEGGAGDAPQISITYLELKALRDSSELVPGMFYRITDYQCTTTQENTRAMNNQFDIIVQALDVNKLSENASATWHEGFEYFADVNLAAWELKYSLDNDTNRFLWADEENGTGVIYYMKDEHNNECPYDFKNIQYKRWKGNIITEGSAKYADLINLYNYFGPDYYDNDYLMDRAQTYYDTLRSMTKNKISNIGGLLYSLGLLGKYIRVGELSMDDPTLYTYLTDGVNYSLSDDAYIVSTGYHDDEGVNISYMVIDNSVDYWFYTFSEGIIDKSTGGFSNITDSSIISEYVYGNELKVYTFYRDVEKLSANVFLGNANSNIFGYDCYSNTFGENCNSNTFGNDCYYNTFGKSCNSNTFGDLCYSNIFGNSSCTRFNGSCYYNTFGDSCSSNEFGDSCYSNIFGNECRYNTFGDNCDSNIFGDKCYSNKFGCSCYSNIFGDNCSSNEFGDSCSSNIFGNDCSSNTLGDSCSSNIFGNDCSSNTFGNSCYSNIFGNSTAQDEIMNHVRYIRFAEGCQYIKLITEDSSNAYVQDIVVSAGVRGNRKLQVSRNAAPVVFEAANTTHIILD
jgi:hypothetical protein